MATTVARLEAHLSADTRQFDRAMTTSQKRMRNVGRAAGYMGGAIFAGLAVAAKRGFDELADSQRVMAQTQAAIKSTGGSANVTAKQITDLSTQLSKMSGVDDEVIQSSENLLLTFRGIRNETGKGNDIFNQATRAALDLSVAFHKDLGPSSILVGKALNDPIRGLTSLQRVGVQFTTAQREQIKALVESGHTMQAQKMILAELSAETAGSAKAAGETLPMQLAKARNAFDEVAAGLVISLLPALQTFAHAITSGSRYLQEHRTAARVATVALIALASALIAARIAQLAMNLAVLANPYVAATVAAVALGAAIYILWQRSKAFREAVLLLTSALLPLGPLFLVLYQRSDNFRDVIQWLGNNGAKAVVAFKDASLNALNKVADAAGKFASALGKVKDALNWIISNAKKIGGVFGTIGGAIGKVTPGDPAGDLLRAIQGGGGPNPRLVAFGRAAQGMGFSVGEHPAFGGVNPVHAHYGAPDHYHGGALDINWPNAAQEPGKLDFLRGVINQWVKTSRLALWGPGVLWRTAGHYDHLHISAHDLGGFLKPGWNLAYNGLGRPEPVGVTAGGNTVNFYLPNYVGSKPELMSWLENAVREFRRRNGRTPF